MIRPLDGITVVSLEHAVAAPFCTRQLADLGARVIKVERPGSGDFARGYDQRVMGQSSHFTWINRSKESLALDVKQPQAKQALMELLKTADVLVQNLAPGAAARMGLSYEALKRHNPKLIVCDISGYGSDGPYRDKKAYDLLIQSEAGFLSVTGTPETPSKSGISVADIAAGMYAYTNILSALLLRGKTGEGSHIDVSMLEAMGEWMGYPLYYGHPKRGGFLPPVPLPRRMWAGGRLRWDHSNPLQLGQDVERVSTIQSVKHKAGRSGELLFVQVEHQFRNAHGVALTEEHDIVYRPLAQPGEAAPTPQQPPLAGQAAWSRTIVPDDVLLFRYSALTFNGHRIHYDRQYVTQVEGYPGLIVHGPLIATLLVDLLRRNLPGAQLASFAFKAVRPTFDLHPFSVHGKPSEDGKTIALWAQDHDGWLTMQATATLA